MDAFSLPGASPVQRGRGMFLQASPAAWAASAGKVAVFV